MMNQKQTAYWRRAIILVFACGWTVIHAASARTAAEEAPVVSDAKPTDGAANQAERPKGDSPIFVDTKTGTVPKIVAIEPPEKEFFSKQLDYEGIPIKAHKEVADESLFAARDRLAKMLGKLPEVRERLRRAGVKLHIIGRNQVTTDLPEWRRDKGKPLAEYNGLTRDQRTRGMGGLLVSCGEENLLRLDKDRYKGRDICVHEFAHAIYAFGMTNEFRDRIKEQYKRSLAKGLWEKSYAAVDPDEFFAELSMWYFGTHGDLHMTGSKPENGREGLEKYDPQAMELINEFYSGK
jgi:hypothetical protein